MKGDNSLLDHLLMPVIIQLNEAKKKTIVWKINIKFLNEVEKQIQHVW
jgi:hypothetical protein